MFKKIQYHFLGYPAEIWLSSIKSLFGLFILVAITSRSPLDPTPLNLIWPFNGMQNWLGLPGALISGFLFSVFGWSALLIPFFLVLLQHDKQVRGWRAFFLETLTILLLIILFSLLFPDINEQVVKFTGLWGYASHYALSPLPVRLVSILLIAGYLVRYFRKYRLNPLLFNIVSQFVAFIFFLSKNLWLGTVRYGRQGWLFFSINWQPKLRSINIGVLKKTGRQIGAELRYLAHRINQIKTLRNIRALIFSDIQAPVNQIKTKNPSLLPKGKDWEIQRLHTQEIFREALNEFKRQYYAKVDISPILKI